MHLNQWFEDSYFAIAPLHLYYQDQMFSTVLHTSVEQVTNKTSYPISYQCRMEIISKIDFFFPTTNRDLEVLQFEHTLPFSYDF